MNVELDMNYKLKFTIVQSFAYNMNSSNIDFIIENIFKQGQNNSNARKHAIFAIKFLSEKAEKDYLSSKEITHSFLL